jgi:hypothetical protein
MFAVIILGIGFIMVAAIFPVAIQQTRLTVDESAAAGIARDAGALLQRIAQGSETAAGPTPGQPLFPKTGNAGTGAPPPAVFSVRTDGFGQPSVGVPATPPIELWNRVRGNMVVASDPRYAWTAMYSREDGAPFIRVYVIVMQQRDRTAFERLDLDPNPPSAAANLQPRLLPGVVATPGNAAAGQPATVAIPDALAPFAAEGAFLIVANSTAPAPVGEYNGQVFRLGVFRGKNDAGNADLYELDPAYDVPAAAAAGFTADVWMVGRGFVPGSNPPVPVGPAMDVAVYTTFLSVN